MHLLFPVWENGYAGQGRLHRVMLFYESSMLYCYVTVMKDKTRGDMLEGLTPNIQLPIQNI